MNCNYLLKEGTIISYYKNYNKKQQVSTFVTRAVDSVADDQHNRII